MDDLSSFVYALLGVLAALPAAYFSAKKWVSQELRARLSQISGRAVGSLEELVAIATADKRLRQDTLIAVYGLEKLWAELRMSSFQGAVPAPQAHGQAPVAVVDPDQLGEEALRVLGAPYILIYKEDGHYRGALPPGAHVTYANSSITLDARLMEALRHMDARRGGGV